MWVIGWRHARLQCKYPRSLILRYFHYYDRRTGLETGFGSLLYKLLSAKAQITKVERTIAGYVYFQTHNNLFFNPETDEMLLKAKNKLNQKKMNFDTLLAMLKEKVEEDKKCREYPNHANNPDKNNMNTLKAGLSKNGRNKCPSVSA